MIETATRRRDALAATSGILAALYAVTFLVGAVLHLGVRIPLGLAVLEEPVIIPATIVEGLCGLALGVGSYSVFAGRTWAWTATMGAHAFALAGVLLGTVALAAGRGPSTVLNTTYHRVMTVVLVVGLALLATPRARAALGAADRKAR